MMKTFLDRKPEETIIDQWQSQIFCQILLDHTVILVSDAPREMVESLHLIYSNSLSDAFCQAVEILHKPEPSIRMRRTDGCTSVKKTGTRSRGLHG